MVFKNIRIVHRLAAAFAAAALFVIGITSFSLWSLSSVHADLGDARNVDRTALNQMGQLRQNLEQRSRCLRNLAIFTGSAELAAERRCVQGAGDAIQDLLRQLERREAGAAAMRGALDELNNAESAIAPLVKNILRFSDGGGDAGDAALAAIQREEMVALMRGHLIEREGAISKATEQLAHSERELSHRPVERANKTYSSIRVWLPVYVTVFLVLGALLCWWITDNIVRPIRKAMLTAQDIATGNLSVAIHTARRDETGQLFGALHRMQEGLHQIVDQIRQAAESIGATSVSLNKGSVDLAQRTQEQAATLEETAASMEQFAASVQQNAQHAAQANQFAQRAQSAAHASGTQMTEAVQTMTEVLASSQRIGDITALIDSIAFQTNILALNAAVEAARAGEQGRGFAVVAAEVRALAQKSAEAAKEIKGLVEQTTRNVATGTQRVELASTSLGGLVQEVGQVAQAMNEISGASKEQALGIDQVSRAVLQLEHVTQQNSSVVEHGAAAAELLQQQAQQLLESVARFQLRDAAALEVRRAKLEAPARMQALAAS